MLAQACIWTVWNGLLNRSFAPQQQPLSPASVARAQVRTVTIEVQRCDGMLAFCEQSVGVSSGVAYIQVVWSVVSST